MGGFLLLKWKKLGKYFKLYHIPFTVKEFQCTFFTFPSKECMISLITKMNKFIGDKNYVFLNISDYSHENTGKRQKACQFF